MPNLNTCVIMGNLTRDPELRASAQGDKFCEMTLAVKRFPKGKEEVSFIDVVAWGRTAENCQRHLLKGGCALVRGYLKQDNWQAKEGGNRSRLKVIADEVQFISSGGDNAGKPAEAAQESQVTEDGIPF